MKSNKYTKPNLPTAQQILEDLADTSVRSHNQQRIPLAEEALENAYVFFTDSQKLESCIENHSKLNDNLNELQLKLQDNINNIKKQIHIPA